MKHIKIKLIYTGLTCAAKSHLSDEQLIVLYKTKGLILFLELLKNRLVCSIIYFYIQQKIKVKINCFALTAL